MSTKATQANRAIRIKTPLSDPDALLLRGFTYREELGRPFEMRLELQSADPALDFNQILGQKVTVTMDLQDAARDGSGQTAKRYFNGHVIRFVQTGFDRADELYSYQAVVVPWLGLLSLASDCRIFQGKTVPNILQEVFSDLGFSDFRASLTANYIPREFCVQYRETALNFVNRIMEQEGIYYFFEHVDGNHTLVLCDSPAAHKPFPGYDTIRYHPKQDAVKWEHVYEWMIDQRMQPGSCVLNDHDYANPKRSLLYSAKASQGYAHGEFEIFDAPGGYQEPDAGQQFARVRLEEIQCRQTVLRGKSTALGLSTGSKFSLTDFPRQDQNQDYLVTASTLEVSSADFTTHSTGPTGFTHACSFDALLFKTPFRTARTTPVPVVHGPQTAVVTGPSGQDGKPYPSPIGSVKVQFRWDRDGGSNENSSFWIRVSQISAGNGWGSMFIPRIGNEVIVSFEEGSPDRPVVTGRVYNADQMPPLSLPSQSLKSYISDDGVNAISFNPADGAQSITIYSPHNDTAHVVGANY